MIPEDKFKSWSTEYQEDFLLDSEDLTTKQFKIYLNWYYENRKDQEFKNECAFYEANT